MKKCILLFVLIIAFLSPQIIFCQVNKDQVGAWYMYFFNTSFKDKPFGFQGDIQYRNWNSLGDLEQLLLRGGITYKPQKADIKFTLGYGNIQTGEFGSSNSISRESRVYQEALLPQKIGTAFYLTHRFRYEQRFVEDQDLRTRYRYNLFINIPLNQKEINDKTVYLAIYNELFINGQKNIGDGRSVEFFDRNRLYAAVGYAFKKQLKVQLGFMRQSTDSRGKDQLQLSLHQRF